MAHNFIEQINIILDPTGNTPLADTSFVSANGSVSNDGTNPNTPFKNITEATDSSIIVLGSDQIYSQIPVLLKTYIGDGIAIFDGNGTESIATSQNTTVRFFNLHFRNFAFSSNNSLIGFLIVNFNFFWSNVTFENNNNLRIHFARSIAQSSDLRFLNQPVLFNGLNDLQKLTRSQFISDSIVTLTIINEGTTFGGWDSNIFINQNIICSSAQAQVMTHSYFEGCTFVIDSIVYPDIDSVKIAIPTAFPFSVSSGANFKGSPTLGEFRSVSINSALLGAGLSGANIGGVNEGLVFNESNVVSSTNVTFNNGNIGLINGSQDGQIVWEDSFSRLVTNPFLHINGVPDFVNNIVKVIQTPNPINPAKLTVQIETADKSLVYRAIKTYRVGYRIGEDRNGLSSGQDDYHQLEQADLPVINVRVTATIQS